MALNVGADFRLNVNVNGGRAVDDLSRSIGEVGRSAQKSARETEYAMRMLPAQFTDVATQLAGGQNPFLILLQQGGQVRDQFGSIGAALSGIGSFLTPAKLAFGGLAATIGTFVAAAIQGYQESINLQRAIVVTGNYAGITASQFETAAARIQSATGATAGAAREFMTASVGGGQFGPASVEAAATAMAQLQRLTGQSSEEIVKLFANMRDGVAKWAAEANKAYNFLTIDQFRYIKGLEEAGQKEAALRATLDALNQSLQGRTVQLGYLETAWKSVTGAAKSAWNAMLNIGREDTLQQKLDDARRQLAAVESGMNDNMRKMFPGRAAIMDREAERLRTLIADTQELMRMENRAAVMRASSAVTTQAAIEREMSKSTTAQSQKISEFDRLLQRYQDQVVAAQKLSVEEQFLAEVQLGRFKDLSSAQINRLQMLAREVDALKAQAQLEEDKKKRLVELERERERLQRETDRAYESEQKRLETLREKYIELGDPTEKYRKQLEEIQMLNERGLLSDQESIAAMNALREKGKDTFADLTRAIEGWGKKATDTFIDFAFNGKASFGDMVSSILADIARIAVQRTIMTPLMTSIFGPGGSGGGAELGGWIGSMFGTAAPFARGGVVNRPTLFPFASGGGFRTGIMGEAGPEAIMPLRRGPDGRLGVSAAGGSTSVNVVVNATTGEQQVDGQGRAARLGAAIAAAVRSEIIQQKRPGGLLAAGA